MNLDYPYRFDHRHRTAETDDDNHIRDLIEQVLFTMPGERVNRPDFGSGARQLVFAPNSPELAATTQFLIQGTLQQFLGHLILVESVNAEAINGELRVMIVFVKRRTGERGQAEFTRGTGVPP